MWYLRYAAFILAISILVIFISRIEGEVTFDLAQYEITMALGLLALAMILLIAILAFCFWLLRSLWLLPKRHHASRQLSRQQRGEVEMARALLALAQGDNVEANRASRAANGLLPNTGLPKLIAAQAAMADGQPEKAKQQFAALVSTQPEIARQGQFNLALQSGDFIAARQHLDAMLKDNRKSRWASRAIFELAVQAQNWPDARKALYAMKPSGRHERAKQKHLDAILYLAELQSLEPIETAQSLSQSLNLAEAAYKLAPDFSPAICELAKAISRQGELAKARRILAKAWAKCPHSDIADCFFDIHKDVPVSELTKFAEPLTRKNRDHVESIILRARAALLARRWAQAEALLDGLVSDAPTRRVCMLMAELHEGQEQSAAARAWLARALRAPADAAWYAAGERLAKWLAVSPKTLQLGIADWRVVAEASAPVDAVASTAPPELEKLDSLEEAPKQIQAIESREDKRETSEADVQN